MKARIKLAALLVLSAAALAPIAAFAQPSVPHILWSPNLDFNAGESAAATILAARAVKQSEQEAMSAPKPVTGQRQTGTGLVERDAADRSAPVPK